MRLWDEARGPGCGGERRASPPPGPGPALARPPRGTSAAAPGAPGGRPERPRAFLRSPALDRPAPSPIRLGPAPPLPGRLGVCSGHRSPRCPRHPPSRARGAARPAYSLPTAAGRRPHSAPALISNSLPSSEPPEGRAERFVAMSRIIPELPAPAARRSAWLGVVWAPRRLCFSLPGQLVLGAWR